MKKAVFILLTASLILGGREAFCLEEGGIDLEPIVITPGRAKEDMSKTPGSITVITRSQIERSNAKTIPELLTRETLVTMRDFLGNGKATNADIRGFGEAGLSNVLVLVDGRRVNNIDLSGTDWIQIPISTVEKIEVLRGAGSVLYGDNASGGVINIITKEPSRKPLGFKTGLLAGSYGTYAERAELSICKGNFSGVAMYDQYRTDGYRVNSDLIRDDINGKLEYSLNDGLKTRFSFANHTDEYGLTSALKDSQINVRGREASVTPDDFATTSDNFVDLGIDVGLGEFGELTVDLAKRKRDTMANFSASGWVTERDTLSYTLNPKYQLNKEIAGRKNKLIAGLDYFDAEQDIADGSIGGSPDKLTLSKRSLAFYLTDQFYLNDKLSASGGHRYEKVHYAFEQEAVLLASDQSEFEESVFNAGLNYNYLPDSNIYLSYADSFRHPLVDEVFSSKYDFGFGPGGGLNVALTPQTARNYEAGIRHAFNKKLFAALSAYIIKVRNEIYFEPSTFLNTSYDNTIHRGIEFQSDFKPNGKIKLFVNYAFTDAFFDGGMYDKKKIPAVPAYKWGAGADYNFTPCILLSLSGNYVGERYFISDQVNILPRMASYFTLDGKISFTKGSYSLYAGVNNIFDEEYYEYGSANSSRTIKNYYPSLERNFILGGEVKF